MAWVRLRLMCFAPKLLYQRRNHWKSSVEISDRACINLLDGLTFAETLAEVGDVRTSRNLEDVLLKSARTNRLIGIGFGVESIVNFNVVGNGSVQKPHGEWRYLAHRLSFSGFSTLSSTFTESSFRFSYHSQCLESSRLSRSSCHAEATYKEIARMEIRPTPPNLGFLSGIGREQGIALAHS
ncbi:hypothetical protein KC333_g23 [Hortaea werneckii]|nr:hypothetical protein KC333_g23 [Hortaea werneckii]